MLLRTHSPIISAGRLWVPAALFVVLVVGSILGARGVDIPGAADSVFVKGYSHSAP